MPGLFERLERVETGQDDRALRAALLDALRSEVDFDAYVWVLTDPESEVGASPLADVPRLDVVPRLIRARYLTVEGRWTSLTAGQATALATSDTPLGTAVREEGMADVASTVCRDEHGCWGFLDLWRRRRFTAEELDLVGRFAHAATPMLRRSLVPTFEVEPSPDAAPVGGPVVLLLTDELRVASRTAASEDHLRALLPPADDRPPVPAAAYNVAAQLLAVEAGVDAHPPVARVHVRAGRWSTLRAARLVGVATDEPSITVTIEPTTALDRAAIFARVHGLTTRESELLEHLVGGVDTRELARRLFLSQHTVQDHLKGIFARTGVHTRRQLVARATGT